MLRLIGLLLPTIFPSWRFFKEVEASPRLEFRAAQGEPLPWRPAVVRVQRIPPMQAAARLFWNRDWNEYLYLVSCSERLLIEPSQHSVDEILAQLGRRHGLAPQDITFRICLVGRDADQITADPVFHSAPPHRVLL